MSYCNILVHVDHTKPCERRLTAAVALATRFNSSLTGAFLQAEAVPAYMVSDAITMPTENLERYLAERSDKIADVSGLARSMFEAAAGRAELSFRWLEVNGDRDDAFIACARRHDLIVAPPVMNAAFGEHDIRVEKVAMACGGPVLIVPPSGFGKDIGRRILVAWNDSRESARALRDAWPFLAQADEICFLTVSRNAARDLDDGLLRHLRQHQCRPPKVVVDIRDDLLTGNVISRHIGMEGADMAVLGLYGHSRLREFVLGGVSRELLAEMPVPLLVSH